MVTLEEFLDGLRKERNRREELKKNKEEIRREEEYALNGRIIDRNWKRKKRLNNGFQKK